MKQKKWAGVRRLSQAAFFFLFVLFIWRSIYPSQWVLAAKFFYAFDVLAAAGVSLAARAVLNITVSVILIIGATAVFGRFFCGWICPMGSMIDAAGYLRKKILPYGKKEPKLSSFRYVKYGILAVLMILALAGIQAVWWFDPITIAGRFISMNLIPSVVRLNELFFKMLLSLTGFPESLQTAYRAIRGIIGGVRSEYFPNAAGIFGLWLFVVILPAVSRRLWCRGICPLGAILALVSRAAPFARRVTGCTDCGKCVSDCRMNAIKADNTYMKEECILCMDCLYGCRPGTVSFSFRKGAGKLDSARRDFLKFAGLLLAPLLAGARNRRRMRSGRRVTEGIIRPPGVKDDRELMLKCIRCGNCMRVCVTNGLQPVITGAGLEGVWTPQLVPEIGYCEYQCTMCGQVCPTGAIPRLDPEVKKKTALGTASVYRNRCIPWLGQDNCLVCEEHCPVADKAIKTVEMEINGRKFLCPVVDKNLCIGCGMCQNVCPVRPVRAIRVDPSVR
ncbi:MAG: 4Fe-4S binding protein [Elusimicrobia bacterium]|nr:4Fe-4S binding protein [Elusimicrobiota bacterium]